MPQKYKIVIADSQYLVVESLAHLIESEIKYQLCGIADNRTTLKKLMKEHRPDLLITDFNLIDYEGLDDLKSIVDEFKNLSLLILTNQVTIGELGKFLKSGIKNISLKTDERKDLLSAIEMAVNQKKQFSDQILEMIIGLSDNKNIVPESSNLTQSETDIVKLIADGYTTKEIAQKKYISYHTVMTHRKNIFRKLDVSNVSEMIRSAARKGLIDYIEYNI
jgi:DNA-binding NarL/FixJ family response regulator